MTERSFVLANTFFLITTLFVWSIGFTCLKLEPVKSVTEKFFERQSSPVTPGQSTSLLQQHFQTFSPTPAVKAPSEYNFPASSSVQSEQNHGIPSGFTQEIEDKMDWKPTLAHSIPAVQEQLSPTTVTGFPKLPPGSSLPPPPNGSRTATLFASATANGQVSQQSNKPTFSQNLSQTLPREAAVETTNTQISLAPQRFFPKEDPTGLEDIFSPALKLSDENELHRRRRNGGPTQNVFGTIIEDNDDAGRGDAGQGVKEACTWIATSAAIWALLGVCIYGYRRVMPSVNHFTEF